MGDVSSWRESEKAQAGLLREALLARADAEAAEVRADDAREEAELARALAERAREEAEQAVADAERGRSRIAFLAEAGRRMAESIDWESTLRAVVRAAVPAVADWTSLTIAEPGGAIRVLAVAHTDPEQERLASELLDRYPLDVGAPTGAALVIASGQPKLVEDISPDVLREAVRDPEHRRLLEELNVRHYAMAPLITPTGVIGVLTFVLGDSGRRFGSEDLQVITSLAGRATLHIQNSRLYAQHAHIARVLQASLRPSALPSIPGAEVAAEFAPAGHEIDVGGDFYDVFPSGDGVWTAIIGDVSGKGPEAAAVTALARHTLRVASLLHGDPAADLALLNQALEVDSTTERFCSVFYARLCPDDDGVDIRFANGGHPSPLLLRVDGSIEAVATGRGPLVGVFADAEYQEATLRLERGEVLLMYTDGVTELRRPDPEFGERELRATLRPCAGKPAEEVVAAVRSHVMELQGTHQRDDIALLAIKATDQGDARA